MAVCRRRVYTGISLVSSPTRVAAHSGKAPDNDAISERCASVSSTPEDGGGGVRTH